VLALGLERSELPLQLLAAAAALLLLLQPAAGAPGHLPQAAAGELHRGLGSPAAGLRLLQRAAVVVGLQLPQLPAHLALLPLQLVPLLLQGFGLPLVALRLPGQLAAAGLQPRQFRLHRQQLVLPQGLHLRLKAFQGGGGFAEGLLGQIDRLPLLLLLPFQGLAAALQLAQLLPQAFGGQQLLLGPADVQALAQPLVGPRPGAVALQALAGAQQLLLDDAAALLALLHLVELGAALVDAAVEEGDAGELIDDGPPLLGAHRHDAGDVALHDHVAAVGVDPQAAQLGLQLLEVAGDAVGAEGAAVGAARRHAQPPADAPAGLTGADPGALGGGLQARLGFIGLPIPQVEVDGDGGFRRLSRPHQGAVDQVGQAFGAHAAAAGQAQAVKNGIEDVALARAIRTGDHRETRFEGDGERPAERFEVGEINLIDVNQPARLRARPI
jgi:hypothetical protein